jgi:dienelactone hydrolase
MTKIQTQTLSYSAGGAALESYLAWDPAQAGPRPGVILLGEWWGMNDYLKRRARQVAELGYVALAADMYGGGCVAADASEAGQLMNGLFADMTATGDRLRAHLAQLRAQPMVDGARIGAMGYCLGGALSLHAARLGLDLKGVISFHGALGRTHEAQPGDISAELLICHGADDVMVPPDDVKAFQAEMQSLGAKFEFIAYPGAKHGFTNPEATEKGEKFGLPLAYNEDVDRQSWAAMKAFWTRVLG